MNISSYAGLVWLGVATDLSLVPDPEMIVAGYEAEFRELLGLAGAGAPESPLKNMDHLLDGALDTLDHILQDRGES